MASSSVLIPDWFGALGIEGVETWDPRAVWERTERDVHLRVPVGVVNSVRPAGEVSTDIVAPDRVLWLDCADYWAGGDGAHGGVKGVQESGGSNFNAVVALGICARFSPRRMNLVLVDLGDTGQFDVLAGLPHVRGYFHGSDPVDVVREFKEYISGEKALRTARFRELEMKDYNRWLRSDSYPEFPGLLVVVNSPGDIGEAVDFGPALQAAVCRSVGMHVFWSFERYPDEAVSGARENASFWGLFEMLSYRIAFSCDNELSSRRFLWAADAAQLPSDSGEAVLHSINRESPEPQWIRFQPFNVIEQAGQGSAAESLIDRIKAVSS